MKREPMKARTHAEFQLRERERFRINQLIVRDLAEQIVAAMQRIEELTPPGEIGMLIPSVDDVLQAAAMKFTEPND
jgi:hypothetical protein